MTETVAPAETAAAADGQPSPDVPLADPGPPVGDDGAIGDESAEGDDQDAQGPPGSEAAKYRVKLREAEHQRDDAMDRVARLQRAAVDEVLAAADIDARLLDAAGHSVEDFLTEEGLVDRPRLAGAARAAAEEFNVAKSRRPAPNPLAGTPIGAAVTRGRETWDRAFTLDGGSGR